MPSREHILVVDSPPGGCGGRRSTGAPPGVPRGRGLGVRLLRGRHTLSPFDPAMPVVFAVGPLCGTPAPTSARLSVVSRSPLTGTVYDCSAGGRFAWRLRAAGLFAILVRGKAPAPSFSPSPPSGKSCFRRRPLDEGCCRDGARAVGPRKRRLHRPAGENGVLFSSVMMGEGNAVGRGGLGAVLGKKNLKAMTVDGNRPYRWPTGSGSTAPAQTSCACSGSPVIFGELGISEYGPPRWSTSCAAADGTHGEFPAHGLRGFLRLFRPGDPGGVRGEEGGLFRLPHPLQEARVRRAFLAGV